MEPRYLHMWWASISFTVWLLLCGLEVPQTKIPKDRGVACSRSSYLVTEVTRPCVGKDPVRFSGCPARGDPIDSRKFLSLTICWKSNQNNTNPVRF